MRERSRSPLSPRGLDKSEITIPKYVEELVSSDSESSHSNSDQEGEDADSVMNNHLKLRKILASKLK